jgi:uncharacterized membrane protein
MSLTKKALLIWYGIGVVMILMLLAVGLNLFGVDNGGDWFSRGFMMAAVAFCWVHIWRKLHDAHRRDKDAGEHA